MKHHHNLLSQTFMTLFLAFTLTASVSAEPANLSLVKKEVKEYYDTGKYHQELEAKIKKAQHYIIAQAIANQSNKKQQQKLALVLDIDETSLSNYEKIVQRDFTGNREQIHKEIMAANAPAIKPMLALYKSALEHGVHVFFVTGRDESEREATVANLTKAGYSKWSGLYLRPANYAQTSIIPFKAGTRAQIAKQGYTIIASIGDQYSDIRGGYTEKGFKLPNPFYHLA